MAYEPRSFAQFTVRERLPRILNDLRSALPEIWADGRLESLQSSLINGGQIDVSMISPTTPLWSEAARDLAGACWRDLPFFGLEFLFYHVVNSAAARAGLAEKAFQATRLSALADSIGGAEAMAARACGDLHAALTASLFGNEMDLSQLVVARSDAENLLVDQRSELAERLKGDAHRIILLADNAGTELIADLILADSILQGNQTSVVLHVKPWPMFVSDAVVSDVLATIAGLRQAGPLSGSVAARLEIAMDEGRFEVVAPGCWGEPRHLNQLSGALVDELGSADVVLAKGDLNYRRFVEDRSWPATTPVSVASVANGITAYALRVAKSDAMVGLDAATVMMLDASSEDWRSSGQYGMVQRIDQGS